MNERDIFLAAIEITDPARRAAYVEQACGSDATLRVQVEELLKTHAQSSQFLETPALAAESLMAQTLVTEASHADEDPHAERESAEAEFRKYLQPATRTGWLGRLGHYEIEAILGRGAFGIVAKAFDEKLHRVVAIKLMNPELAATSPPRKRFLREARTAAAVTHENIVAIYAVEEEPIPYLVMEYIPGQTLQQWLEQHGPLEPAEILRVGRQVAAGLAAAHAANLIHRDIKPSNILLTGGAHERAKISDFGLARAVDDATMTSSGVIAGTPMYMAPEQARGETLDHRADLFSLGSVFYQMASGRPPFRAANSVAVLKRVCEDTPRPLDDVIPGIPGWLETIIFRLLEKKRDDRYQTAQEVADLLARCQSEWQHQGQVTCVPGRPATAETQVLPARRGDPTASGRWPIGWLTGGVIAVVAVMGLLLINGGRQNPEGSAAKPAAETTATATPQTPAETPAVASWHGWPADAPAPALAPFDAAQAKQHQAAWAKYLQIEVEYMNALGMKFVLVPPGEFTMGSTAEEIAAALKDAGDKHWQDGIKSEAPQHTVILTQPMYLGVNEVTQAEYEKVMGVNPSHFAPLGMGKKTVAGLETADHPVEIVSWNDAAEFCAKLSKQEKLKPFYFRASETITPLDGTGYRLPSEAEWEFACRAGTATKYWIGDNDKDLVRAGWFAGNSGDRTHAAGELRANPFGLSDMHGNAWEWVQDEWDSTYYGQFPEKPAINPGNPFFAGSRRVVRGGGWNISASRCGSSNRLAFDPARRDLYLGFRVSLPVDAVRQALQVDGAKVVTPGVPMEANGNLVAEQGRSAWDDLDPAQIPEAERVPELPKELVAVLGEHRQRHAGAVASIAIRPDGKQFVTAAKDGLRFWDATTFQQTSHFRPKGYERSAAAYLPQGKQLVVGGEGNLGQIWDLNEKGISNDVPVSLPRGTSMLPHTRFLSVSPDEKWLIRCQEHFKVHLSLMSLANTEPAIVAEYPDCRFVTFSPDNHLLAILREDDKSIHILELGDGAPVERHVLKAEPEAQDDRPSKGFQQLVFLGDGRLATADNNDRTWFWNLKGDQPQILFSTKRADQFLHAATQAPIVVTAESGVSSILRIDADQAVLKHHATWTEYGRPESNLTSFAIFPDGRTAITGHLHGAIRFWDISGEKAAEKHPIALQPVASPYVDLAVLPGVVATRDEENHLRLWQPSANGLVEHPATKADEPQKYLPITASRDGRFLVTRPIWDGPGCTLWQWDGQKLAPQLSIGRGGAWSAAISSDNRRLAIGYRGTVELWDITARPPRLEKTLKAANPNAAAYQTAFAKNDTLLIATMNQAQSVWDLSQVEPLPQKLLADREPFHVAVSPTRDLLAVDGGGTQLLSLKQFPPQPVITLKSAPSQNGALAFSSDGKLLAVTDDLSVDRSIIDVHDTETGVRKHRITLPMPLRRMLFTEDNRHLITMNGNGTIYVLRLAEAPTTETTSTATRTPPPWQNWPVDAPKPAIAPFDAAQAKKHQEEWAAYLKVPVEYTNSIGMKFRLIPPGEFTMGSTEEETRRIIERHDLESNTTDGVQSVRSESPEHTVVLTQPFYLSTREASRGEFARVGSGSPPNGATTKSDTDAEIPVGTSWDAAARFANQLGRQGGLDAIYEDRVEIVVPGQGTFGYRLPTEAEWEYACRAGTSTRYWTGDDTGEMTKVEWRGNNSDGKLQPVGRRLANPFGLHDMHGNIREWCQDAFTADAYAKRVSAPAVDPFTPFAGLSSAAVMRGGDFGGNNDWDARAAARRPVKRDNPGPGFRLRLSVDAVRHLEPRRVVESVLAMNGYVYGELDGRTIHIAPEDADQLRRRGDLKILAITLRGGPSITNEGLVQIANLPDLRHLSLIGFGLSDDGLESLGVYPQLRSLYLEAGHRPPRSLELIGRWTQVERLDLHLAEFTGKELSGLENLQELQTLRTGNLMMTDAQTRSLSKLPKLKYLWLMGEQLNDDTLRNVARLPALTAFTVTYADKSNITNGGARALAANPRIVSVNLDSTKVDDQGLAFLAERKNWEEFLLDGTRITDAGLPVLRELPKLRTLSLSRTGISDEGLVSLGHCAALEVLYLKEMGVTDAGLAHLERLTNLRELHLDRTRVTPAVVERLRKRWPNCKITAEELVTDEADRQK